MVTGVVSVGATWVVSFLAPVLRPEGEIWLRKEQGFLQTIRRFLQRKSNTVKMSPFVLYIDQ